jgi:hypothetical protein
MSGTITEVVDTNTFYRPHQRHHPTVHMSYIDIARSSGSLLTQSQTNIQDGESVDTTIASNVSRQDTYDSGMNMITRLSLMKKRMEEIDNQREEFTTKQQQMDRSISTVTSSVSKLSAYILEVWIDMNIMSDKLEKKVNNIIALLATTQTPTRKVARGTNSSPVKHAASKKGHVDAFGGAVTQRKTHSPPASPARKVNAETWANMCDEDVQEEYMQTSVNILMEVDSTEADGNQRESSIMGVDAAARTHIPATQGSSSTVAISRRCNMQSDPKSDFGQVQTRKVAPEALALLPFQKDPITNKRETYQFFG